MHSESQICKLSQIALVFSFYSSQLSCSHCFLCQFTVLSSSHCAVSVASWHLINGLEESESASTVWMLRTYVRCRLYCVIQRKHLLILRPINHVRLVHHSLVGHGSGLELHPITLSIGIATFVERAPFRCHWQLNFQRLSLPSAHG